MGRNTHAHTRTHAHTHTHTHAHIDTCSHLRVLCTVINTCRQHGSAVCRYDRVRVHIARRLPHKIKFAACTVVTNDHHRRMLVLTVACSICTKAPLAKHATQCVLYMSPTDPTYRVKSWISVGGVYGCFVKREWSSSVAMEIEDSPLPGMQTHAGAPIRLYTWWRMVQHRIT